MGIFLYGKNAYVTGIGERIFRHEFPKYFFLLVKPKINFSTKEEAEKAGVDKITRPDFSDVPAQKLTRLGNILAIGQGAGPPKDELWWLSMIFSITITIGGVIWMDRISRTYLERLIAEAE